jgi:hypothetical protein
VSARSGPTTGCPKAFGGRVESMSATTSRSPIVGA